MSKNRNQSRVRLSFNWKYIFSRTRTIKSFEIDYSVFLAGQIAIYFIYHISLAEIGEWQLIPIRKTNT